MNTDPGARLRALYANPGGVAQIFSRKVRDYVASRPDYPEALFETLAACGGPKAAPLAPGAQVVDLGAGTGLLTAGLLARGWQVCAVEPSAEMRAAADATLHPCPGYQSREGTAEAIPVQGASFDLVTAAQAFHWFDVPRARTECLRVLKPGGQVALVWNDRVLSDPLHQALDRIFETHGGPRRAALVAHEAQRDVTPFYGSQPPRPFTWPHAHRLDLEGLISLVFSRSYMPERESEEGRAVMPEVAGLFEQMARDGSVLARYDTHLYLGGLGG